MNLVLRHPAVKLAALALATTGIAASGMTAATAARTSDHRTSSGTSTAKAHCPAVTWGSTPETVPGSSPDSIVGARAGRHECFDRFVIDVAGAVKGYDVRYVDRVFFGGAGHLVDLRGGAVLQVIVRSPALGAFGQNETELVDVRGFRTIRQVAMVDAWDMPQAKLALGVRARLPFRVFVLPGSRSRVVVDVAHRW